MQIIFQKTNWKRRLIEQWNRFRSWLTHLKRWQAFVLILIVTISTAFLLYHYVYINRSWFLLEYDAPLEDVKSFVKLDDLIEISQLLSAAIELVQRGGQVVRQIYHQNTVTQLNQSIVTNADLQSNQEIVAGLKKGIWPKHVTLTFLFYNLCHLLDLYLYSSKRVSIYVRVTYICIIAI